MPSTSKKQHRFMEMIAHDPKKAKQLGIKQSVGKDFVAADKGKKFKVGGLPQDINKQKLTTPMVEFPILVLKNMQA